MQNKQPGWLIGTRHGVDPSLHTALGRLDEAEMQFNRDQMAGNSQQVIHSQAAMDDAADMYTTMLSNKSGVSEDNIRTMHSAGVSWGNMADELGMQASSSPNDGETPVKTMQ